MIVYVLVKGAPLTKAEFDGNFHDVDGRITAIEDNPPEARSIEDIIAVGNSLIIQYNDSTEDGPFPLPTTILRGRGDWAPSTIYLAADTVQHAGVVYVVPTAHTSALTFDPGANDGDGHDFYSPLFDLPALTIPVGGGEGYVLSKASDTDYDMQWQNRGMPAGGSTGEVLTKVSGDDFDTDWGTASFVPTVVTVPGSSFTPSTLSNAQCYYRCTNAAGCTVTIPSDFILPFPIGTEMHFRQCGPGSVVIQGQDDTDGDVFVDAGTDFDTVTDGSGSVITVKKIGTDLWDVFGRVVDLS